MQQPTDERGFAVVDAATGEETQQILAFVFGQVGVDIGGDEFALMRH